MKKQAPKFKWKRIGKCKQCGLCCLFSKGMFTAEFRGDYYYFLKKTGCTEIHRRKVKYKKNEKFKRKPKKDYWIEVIMGKLSGCPQLMFNKKGKILCSIHDKKPKTCKVFPESPDHKFWDVLKHVCGYKFVKVKINKT